MRLGRSPGDALMHEDAVAQTIQKLHLPLARGCRCLTGLTCTGYSCLQSIRPDMKAETLCFARQAMAVGIAGR